MYRHGVTAVPPDSPRADRGPSARDTPGVTRLAPSPTGALHLGNARTFLITWALARRRNWRIVLRIEDLDGPRVKPGAAEQAIDLLRWLGLDWDEGPHVQSRDIEPYRDAMRRLAESGAAYPCRLTRAEVDAAAGAPQEGAHDVPYPASLRPAITGPRVFDDPSTNWRFVVPPGPVEFVDAFAGPQAHEPSRTIGDFVVWTQRAQPAYQLAVVVDDHRQGVTQVVRGDDLLDSAARQLLLYRALGLPREPAYTHLPLVRGQDGRRLAKRHGDTRLDAYRSAGVPAERVIALLARWSTSRTDAGVPSAMSAAEFAAWFRLADLPPHPTVFTPEDDRWLRAAAR